MGICKRQSGFPKRYVTDPHCSFRAQGRSIIDLDLVQWVVCKLDWADEKAHLACMHEAMVFAATTGNLDMIELDWRARVDNVSVDQAELSSVLSPDLMDGPAANGHLAILQWLQDHQCQGCTHRAMDRAAANDPLAVIQWLYRHRSGCCTVSAMNDAAARGNLEMVRWLHENRSEGCTVRAMDLAARGGHLEMIRWLHENRSEGCTTGAMDNAAGFGHMDLIQWLHENRSEGCTTNAMNYAASYGRLDVIQFLHANRQEGYTSVAKSSAAANGHFETFEWLDQNRPESFDQDLTDENAQVSCTLHGTRPLWLVLRQVHRLGRLRNGSIDTRQGSR